MSRRGVDLSFLNEEEARQIFRVLERDSQLKRSERERISKLHKKKEDTSELPGATGQWFEEIQRRKFHNDADVGRMLKQPLAHRLRRAFGNDSTNAKDPSLQIPQNPKNPSPSIFGGLRTPFASLFSSFRKSKRQHAKPQQNEPQGLPRYDCFPAGSHTSSKVEKMAKTEACESSLLPEPTNDDFDTGQAAAMEDNMCTWNEQLENELLRVLGSLDDQLAQEQSQNPANRRISSDYGSRTSEINPYSAINQPCYLGRVQRNERSMFLSEGPRTLRAKDDYKPLVRRRTLYDTYAKRNHAENHPCWDTHGTPPALKRRHSTRSLGRSSEGSLQHSSGPCGSGFEQKDFMPIDTVNRSYSLSSLSRRSSVDQLFRARPLHPLEGSQRIPQRNYCCSPKRAPLSSVMWNTTQSSEHPLYSDRIFRTQSLMEFGPTSEGTYPCFLQENTKSSFYRSKVNYRRVGPNVSHSAFPEKHVDHLYYRENYVMRHQLERNISKCFYRYPSFHGRMNQSRKSFPSGRPENHPWRPAGNQYYNDDVGLVNANRKPAHQSHWQSVRAKEIGLQQGDHNAESHAPEYRRSMEYPDDVQPFLTHAEGTHSYPVHGGSVPVGQAECGVRKHNLFIGAGPAVSDTLIKHFPPKTNFKNLDLNEARSTGRSSEADSGSFREMSLSQDSKQVDTANPTLSQRPPPRQTSLPVKPALLLNSKGQTKLTSAGDLVNINLLNIHAGSKERGKGDAARSDFDQTPSPQLTPVCQSFPQEGDHSKTSEIFKINQGSEKMNSSALCRDAELLVDDKLLDSCPEISDQSNRLVRHSESTSISGMENNSPSKTSITYYTLAKKSASVDGNIVLEKPVISAPREIPFKHRTTVEVNLEPLELGRIEKKSSSQIAKHSLVNPVNSSSSPPPNNVTRKQDLMQTQGSHFLSSGVPNSCMDSTDSEEKEVAVDSQSKAEMALLSKSEETDSGNPLKQYKTTSTLTVSIEEDNVKYQELVSVYYTLPRKQSRTLCNLFGDNGDNANSSPVQEKNQTPQKKYEVRIGLATVAFPSSSQNKETANSSGLIAAIPSTSQNSRASDEENSHILNPMTEDVGTSQSQCVREKATGSPKQTAALISGILLNHQKPHVAIDNSINALSNVLSNLHIECSTSVDREGSEEDTLFSFSSSESTNSALKAHHEHCHPPVTSSDLCIPPSNLIADNQEGRLSADLESSTTVKSTNEKATQEAEVKARRRYSCRIIGLPVRGDSFRKSTDKALTLETTTCSLAQNQRLQANTDSTISSKLQPDSLESSKSEQKVLQKPFCADPQRSTRNSVANQNFDSQDQLRGTTQEPFDCSENKLTLDSTKDRTSDIEKRKNRSSIKNKLAAMYKTSRKFSTKKSSSPKPHIKTIFSQNDAPLETDIPHNVMTSSGGPQLFLEPENKNQNQKTVIDEFKARQPDGSENKGTQISEDPLLLPSETRRPFTNLCNQKRESLNLRQNTRKAESTPHPTAPLPKEIKSMLSSHAKACDEVENHSHSRISVAHPNQKKKYIGNVTGPLSSPLPSNISEVNVSPLQKVPSPVEYDHCEHMKQLKRLRNPSLPWVEAVIRPSKPPRERRFSESSYAREPHDRLGSGNNLIKPGGKYSRKFKSYSELLSCDENENWEINQESNKNFGSRRVLYPSIEFGIFGKEQQQAFLDNIKRSLTEGRLWRPCLLKNPRSLRKEEGCSTCSSDCSSSNLAARNTSAEGSSTREQHGEGDVCSSDSDSDTTTDDEYYLSENDKESEL